MLNLIQQFPSELIDDLVLMIEDDIQNVVNSRSRWMDSLVDITKNYLGISPEDRYLPWDGASDIFIPMTMISVETAHPRILSGVVGHHETITATPTDSSSVQAADNVTRFLNWTLQAHSQLNAYPTFDKLLHSSELFGRSYSRLNWKKDFNTITRRYTMPRYQKGAGALMKLMQQLKTSVIGAKSLEVPYAVQINRLLGNRLVRVQDMENTESGTNLYFQYYVDGKIREGEAFIPTPEPQTTFIYVFLTVEEVSKDGGELHIVLPPDLYHPVDENNLKDCSFVAERYWANIEDLYQLRQEGLLYATDDDWEAIVGDSDYEYDYNIRRSYRESRPESESTAVESEYRDLYARAYGDQETSNAYQGVEVVQYHRRLRLDGVSRDYIIDYLPEHRIITRIVELGVEHPSGQRPYNCWEFMHATDNSVRSLGLGHLVMDLQCIINDIFNKQMDRDDLLNMPFGFYKPTAMTKGQNLKVEPGKLIATNDPTAFNFPNWGRQPGADMPYIQTLLGFVERLTSATNYFQGSAPSQPNAPRTFGATAAIIQEGNINFNLHIKRYQESLYNLSVELQDLYYHFMPEEMEFMAPGADSLTKISRDDLSKQYGYVFNATAENTNPAVKRELAGVVYQAMAMNPLIQTNVTAFYNLTRRFALAHGWMEFDKDVPKPAPEQSHAPMSQIEEIEAMRKGWNPSVLPVDNHEDHIKVIEEYIMSEMGASSSQEMMTMLATHLTQHQQMNALLQRQQMLTQNAGGVQPGLGKNPAMVAGNETGPQQSGPGGPNATQSQ